MMLKRCALLWFCLLLVPFRVGAEGVSDLEQGFLHPPDSARPWVYWFVMDGNLNREGITADLEALKRVGVGGVLFMEVDVGIPKGPVKFMSAPWRELFKHANAEAARLGLVMTMPASPGWTGSGGPWVKPEQSMQKLVFSETNLAGPQHFEDALPRPPTVAGFYRDVAVLAFPTPAEDYRIKDISEKAVYHRGHFSSEPGVKALLPSSATYPGLKPQQVVAMDRIVDLTGRLDAQGRLAWAVPEGKWTVIRFGHTSTGANTRPAPEPGLGLECDKLDKAALEAHFNDFLGKLMQDIGPLTGKSLTSLHIDSWEMGPQNWTAKFPQEFRARRGYDLVRYLPVMTGRVVDSLEVSERFLWDLRQTVLELIADNHAGYLAELAHRHGIGLSIEPYDGTPCDDMTYGSRADVPMGEFWRDTFKTWFSCTEASSIGHTCGKRIVQAEAFTSGDGERWLAYPGSLKTLGDWAFCDGINRFVFHRYAHQPWLDRWPGMTMGPYGIHYDRTQTWFEQSKAWVEYLTRCQFLLQQGLFVADVCFLKPEASPQVFRPPKSATGDDPPERPGYNFDGMTPETLLTRASVKDGRLALPDGMSYRVLVLPETETMTPALLRKIKELVAAGGTVVGPPPLKSPGLSNYPQCDAEVTKLAHELWGASPEPTPRRYGKGLVVGEPRVQPEVAQDAKDPLAHAKWIWHKEGDVFCDFGLISALLGKMGVPPDFESDGPLRYIHRKAAETDIYFIANREERPVEASCLFRVAGKAPELWDAVTGTRRGLAEFKMEKGRTVVPMRFEPAQSFFVIFRKPLSKKRATGRNFPGANRAEELAGPWEVSFNPKWGGPEKVIFQALDDWSKRPEEGIKFYSGTAIYRKAFDLPPQVSIQKSGGRGLYLDLGVVKNLAQVRLNGRDLGVVWCAPWRVDITGAAKATDNQLEITVVNLWPNRLIGDQLLPPERRLTWTTWNPFTKDTPLLESGLLGPVTIWK